MNLSTSNKTVWNVYLYLTVICLGYEDCLKCFVLKKFILLVYFLDVAKRKRLIQHNPCLFGKHAKYKVRLFYFLDEKYVTQVTYKLLENKNQFQSA